MRERFSEGVIYALITGWKGVSYPKSRWGRERGGPGEAFCSEKKTMYARASVGKGFCGDMELLRAGESELGMRWKKMKLERCCEVNPKSSGRILSLGLTEPDLCF